MRAAHGLLLAALVLAAVAAPAVAQERGIIRLEPEESREIPVFNRQYQRVAFSFNVTPSDRPVGFDIHYLRDGGVVYERPHDNFTSQRGTFFPLRAGPFFFEFRNWGDGPVTVRFEWYFPRPVPPTRDVPAVDLLAAFVAAGTAALLLARGRR